MKDIETRNDLIILIDAFYNKVLKDDVISGFFTETVILEWDKHIPVMYDFWETTLLGASSYSSNAMLKHIELNAKRSLKEEHFSRWLNLWEESVTSLYKGEVATLAIQKAQQIGDLMKYKLNSSFL